MQQHECEDETGCECERLPELNAHLAKLKGFALEQTRLISQLFKQEQIEFSDDFMRVLDSLMQAYANVQKQIRVLSAKTTSLLEFKQR